MVTWAEGVVPERPGFHLTGPTGFLSETIDYTAVILPYALQQYNYEGYRSFALETNFMDTI